MKHIPVLLQEIIDGLKLSKGDSIVDGTIGSGGHSLAFSESLEGDLTIYAIDLDPKSIERASETLSDYKDKVTFLNGNFKDIKGLLDGKKVNKILVDLGYSSDQLEDESKGISFKNDGPLDMRLDGKQSLTAESLVNTLDHEDLEVIIKNYGEEKYAWRIAGKILERREEKPFTRTRDLADFIKEVVPKKYAEGRLHPATRTFQALRIAVNDEFENLEKFLDDSIEVLEEKGRVAVISFHSGEDRIVKQKFKEFKKNGLGAVITKRPIVPTDEEIKNNVRSRSAKLRIFEKN
jgi:16S rRNA (cytosine1402-N4)-methyltransferase